MPDAQRGRTIIVVQASDRETAPRTDLLDQAEIDQLGDELLHGAALQLGGQDDPAIPYGQNIGPGLP